MSSTSWSSIKAYLAVTVLVARSSQAMAATVPGPTRSPAQTTPAGPPYVPAGISVDRAGGLCVATLTVTPTNPTQPAIDCSELATPTVYSTTITSSIGVDCGGCSVLKVAGDVHGCPLIPFPTTTITADEVGSTIYTYVCSPTPG